MTELIDRLECAWAAGFFDGEGYVAFGLNQNGNGKGTRYRRISVQVTQIDPRVLERFKDAVGIGSVGGPYEAKGRPHSMWKYHTAGFPAVKQVFDRMRPFLSPIKSAQFAKALEDYEKSPVATLQVLSETQAS